MVPHDAAPSENAAGEEKRAYAPPSLVKHGTVEEVTQAVSGANTDGLGGSQIL